MADDIRRTPSPEGIVVGVVVMMLGVILLLDRMEVIHWAGAWHFWPFVLIAAGAVKLLTPQDSANREGGWLLFIGVWLLLNELRILRIRHSWPLFLVAIGTAIAWKALRGSSKAKAE